MLSRLLALPLIALALGCPARAATPYVRPTATGTTALQISNLDPQRTRIALAAAEVARSTARRGALDEVTFELPGEPTLMVDGAPALPHVTRYYRVAELGAVEWQVTAADYESLDEVDVPPFAGTDAGYRDPGIYAQDAWYPASPVQVSEPMVMRDFRVVSLTLYPVQVNPVTQQARVYRNLECELVSTDEPGENELTQPRRPSGAYAALYRGVIANLNDRALDDITTTPGSYLILCRDHPSVVQFADSLANWKRMLGYAVAVDARASWTVPQMRVAIQMAYANFDPPLEYVTIIGDPQAGTLAMPTDGPNYDHTFGLGNNGDELEDITVGRLSVSSAAELATVNAKLMNYERNPALDDTMWTRRALLWANIEGNTIENRNTMNWSRHQFIEHTGVDSPYVVVGPTDIDTLRYYLGRGAGYFFWRGSFIGQMDPAIPFGLDPSAKLPVVLTITCGTGNFDQGTSLSEAWLIAGTASNPKGGVACIGTATSNTHEQYNNPISAGLVYNICNLGVENLGVALVGAKWVLRNVFPGGGPFIDGTIRWTNLMGDPALALWTERIRPLEVEHPTTLAPGANCVPVHVLDSLSRDPVADALVVLYKADETFAQLRTDAQGHADVPVTIMTAGTMSLCVSLRNHKPYLMTIPCAPADLALNAVNYSVIDGGTEGSAGNQNGHLEPGEVIELPVWVRNHGSSETAEEIWVELTSPNPRLVVLSGTAEIASLPPGDSAQVMLRLQASWELNDEERIPLSITCRSGIFSSCSVIPLLAYAPRAYLLGAEIQGGNGRLDPGETVSLTLVLANTGTVSLSEVTAELQSLSPFVLVEQGHTTFPGLPPGTSTLQDGPAPVVRAVAATYPGTPVPLRLIVRAAAPYADTLQFDLVIGTRATSDPSGPDAYGYYAYDNTDTAYSPTQAYDWVDIRAVGTNLHLNDPGEQFSADSIMSRLRTLPFEFIFYGQAWSTITICSNGWAAFGDRTDQDQNENYPIPGPMAPDALLAPFWDDLRTLGDGLGVWDYFDAANHRYMIQWEARSINGGLNENFQIVLLDPGHLAALDGSGIVIFQYQEVHDVTGFEDIPFATVGIEAPGCLVGLQYRYANVGASGAAPLSAGLAVTFTTDVVPHFGGVIGRVTDALSGSPIAQAMVYIGATDSIATNEQGEFSRQSLRAGVYPLRVTAAGYEMMEVENVVIYIDSLNRVDLELTPLGSTAPEPPVVHTFQLAQNYPNPFNSSTRIEFELPQAATTTLRVYNLLGEAVATLIDGYLPAGTHRVTLDSQALGSGVYCYRLNSGDYVNTKKLVLLK
ncbi:carboxypeptidase regulatory-like domain-containing protein [candidate division KSB1 bacterium]|nr:carboxypeptidase regulatory-like domain-containing protein [candidate division KSB1 bacterium]